MARSKKYKDILFWVFLIGFMAFVKFTEPGRNVQAGINRIFMMSPDVKDGKEQLIYNDLRFKNQSQTLKLADLKGKVVFVNYWATWCPPCRAELPSIQRLWEAYGDQIAFITLSNEVYSDPAKLADYMEQQGLDFPVYYPVGETPALLETSSIPASWLIGKEGQVLMKEKGASDWSSPEVLELIAQELKASPQGNL